MRITVTEQAGERLDVFLCDQLSDLSRSRIQTLIKSGHIRINNQITRAKTPVMEGDEITVEIPATESREMVAQDIPLNILFEDEEVLVINKPSGLVVHPAAGNPDGTLVNALLHHCQGTLPTTGEDERPGIVHRLDKDTSGCIVTAKTDRAQRSLLAQFAERQTQKLYLAITQQVPAKQQGTIFTHLGRHPVARQKMAVVNPGSGRTAITDYYTLASNEDRTSLVLCVLHTGRTHQIRVHLKHLGAPILADPIYANLNRQPCQPGRLMLHAWRLSFHHPTTKKLLTYEAPVPEEFSPWLQDPVTSLLEQIRHTSPDQIPSLLPTTR